jgi:hypothetical protein
VSRLREKQTVTCVEVKGQINQQHTYYTQEHAIKKCATVMKMCVSKAQTKQFILTDEEA